MEKFIYGILRKKSHKSASLRLTNIITEKVCRVSYGSDNKMFSLSLYRLVLSVVRLMAKFYFGEWKINSDTQLRAISLHENKVTIITRLVVCLSTKSVS